ncbi:carboxypeptidase regulatory-like domain-containing protein [Microbacterium sp. LMB2-1.2]|uniref:SdrD B-like domain-containing protein n=1 Tax=Microbacterium sp. LMB2-1.2 TaxID=3135239 RepID=UPI003424A58E
MTRRVVAAAIVAVIVIAGLIGGAEAAHAVNGTVAGAVYQDFDDDGTRDPAAGDFGGDTGLAGVAVTVTDSTGAVVGTATTAANGSYSVNAVNAATAAVRVEFALPNNFRSARIGAGNGSTVQFVNLGATNVNVGMTQDGMVMTEQQPLVVVPNQRSRITANTSPQPPTRPTPNYGSLSALLRVPYSTVGNPGSGRTTIALQRQIGTTWGTANYGTTFVMSGAFFRRGTEVGPAGLGAIYLTDATSATPNATPFVQIPNAGIDPRGSINPENYDWFHDSAAFDAVGRVGLGDLEISSDQRTLYAVNLNDRQLYAVPLIPGINPGAAPTAGTPEAIPIPLSAASGCAPENVHPHGLGTFRGALYVTLTCVGPATSDLRAYVIPMDQSTRQFGAPVLNVPLNFSRPVHYSDEPPTTATSPYGAWRTTFQSSPTSPTARDTPTPLASSVTFDEAGNLALSIKDRTADQNGVAMGSLNPNDNAVYNYIGVGDLLRACVSAAGDYVLESDGRCGAFTATQPNNNFGPGGGKFYETVFALSDNRGYHGNTGLGSALQLPGYPNILGTVIDPTTFGSDGVRLFNNLNGRTIRSALLGGGPDEQGRGNFGKAGGLGDLSALVAVAPVEIGNRVWFDADGDGVQDAGERPLAGVTVRLFDANGIVVATAVTDAQGNYLFSSSAGTSSGSAIYGLGLLPDTEYEIRLDNANDYGPGGPLDNLIPTRTTAGSDPAVDSNGVVEGPTLITATVRTPGPGAADHTFDFGFAPELSLGNRLWFDTGAGAATNNGRFDPGEDPIVGAVVELLDGAGLPVLDADGDPVTTRTDANGFYRFDGLLPGDYRVRVAAENFAAGEVLDGWLSSTGASAAFGAASNNTDKGVDSADPATTGITSGTVTLALNAVTGEVDAGATGAGANSPGGDAADNLTVDFGFIQPYDLTLVKQLTSGAGPYQLGDEVTFSLTPTNNGPGDAVTGFTVTDRLPAGLEFVEAEGEDWSAAVVAGQEITLTWNGPALGGGEAAEPITVTARVSAIDAGRLRNVAVVEPSPDQRTPETIPVGSTPDRFENGDPTPDPASPSNNDDGVEVPIAPPTLSLGNRLWFDTGTGPDYDNGAFDAGEQPVVGAVVELLDANGAPVLDADGDPITTTTDANGFYRFDGLTPGDYVVSIPARNFAADGPLRDFLSSTGSSPTFDGASNNVDKGVDAPFPAITGIRSGLIALAPGVTGEVDPSANGPGANGPFGDQFDNLTADFGFVPGLSLGNRLWFDSGTGDGEANNGRYDAGEAPVVGAVVELLDDAGEPVLDADGEPITTTTDANGFYRFDGLAAGDYTVRVAGSNFAPGEPLDGWFSSTPTSTNAQENNADKGVNAPNPAATGIVSNVVTLSHVTAPLGDVDAGADGAGGHGPNGDAADLLTVDFAFTQAFAVGDFVWLDNDGDGQQDPGEPPVPGVLVTLLDEDGNPVVDLNGDPVAPVRTDDNGHYVFDNLPPGIYRVGFSDLPAQYRHTRHHEGDVTTDSDLEPDGMSPPFVLGPAGENTTDVVPGDGVTVAQRIDRTIDAGIVPVLAVGDFVWIDANRDGRQDPGEVPVAGVTVELLDANGDPVLDADGNPVPATTTDAAGHYVFDNLFPGDYRIRFSGWPEGYVPTMQSAPGTSTAEDSNPDVTGLTPVFSLTGGGTNMRPVEAGDGTTQALQINPTIDLGIVAPLFAVGDYVWFDKDRDGVQDAGEKPVPGMTVTLFAADGTPALDWCGQPVPPVKTDGNGHYLFDGLPAGDYYVEFSGVPAGYRFTGQGSGGASDSNANTLGRTPVFTLGIGARDMRTVVAVDGTILASFLNPTIDAGLVEIEKPLPPTGAVIPWILIVLSLVLVGGGATLLTLRRRRG